MGSQRLEGDRYVLFSSERPVTSVENLDAQSIMTSANAPFARSICTKTDSSVSAIFVAE